MLAGRQANDQIIAYFSWITSLKFYSLNGLWRILLEVL